MRAAVTDTSPLRYLVVIGAVEVLPRLFETVTMPDVVHAELLHVYTPAPVRRWANALPAWLTVVAAPSDGGSDLRRIDDGEQAAIMLGLSLQADVILMDDRAAIVLARALRAGLLLIDDRAGAGPAPRRDDRRAAEDLRAGARGPQVASRQRDPSCGFGVFLRCAARPPLIQEVRLRLLRIGLDGLGSEVPHRVNAPCSQGHCTKCHSSHRVFTDNFGDNLNSRRNGFCSVFCDFN